MGICSTTYGDLVCRGCKRFAHEIVQWNGYDEQQQQHIWQRLHRLRDEVVAQVLTITDHSRFADKATLAGLSDLSQTEQVYELLRHLAAAQRPLADAGLAADSSQALSLLQSIDAEVYTRSVAHYERNFRVPV